MKRRIAVERLYSVWVRGFLIAEGSAVRFGDRRCVVTDIERNRHGKRLRVLPVGGTEHLVIDECRWDLLEADTEE